MVGVWRQVLYILSKGGVWMFDLMGAAQAVCFGCRICAADHEWKSYNLYIVFVSSNGIPSTMI